MQQNSHTQVAQMAAKQVTKSGSKEDTNTPLEAYHFSPVAQPTRFYAEESTGKDGAVKRKRRFAGVGYSGEVIPNHFWWGNVVFDLPSMQVPDKLAMLLNHDFDKRVGYTTASRISAERGLEVEGDLLSNEYAQEVAQDSDDGFPWEMSVHIEPGVIERVEPGTKVTVNNRELMGPLTVFKNSRIRECSFCAVGYDANTTATAFSRAAATQTTHEDTTMTKEEQDRMAALEAENAALKADKQAAETKLQEFSKAQAAAKRDGEVQALFSDLGMQFSAEAAAPYAALDDAAFAAIAAQMRKSFKKAAPSDAAARNKALFKHVATDGAGDNDDAAPQPSAGGSALVKFAQKRADAAAHRANRKAA